MSTVATESADSPVVTVLPETSVLLEIAARSLTVTVPDTVIEALESIPESTAASATIEETHHTAIKRLDARVLRSKFMLSINIFLLIGCRSPVNQSQILGNPKLNFIESG
jgi:hypothetical protein